MFSISLPSLIKKQVSQSVFPCMKLTIYCQRRSGEMCVQQGPSRFISLVFKSLLNGPFGPVYYSGRERVLKLLRNVDVEERQGLFLTVKRLPISIGLNLGRESPCIREEYQSLRTVYYFPLPVGDETLIEEESHAARVRFRGLRRREHKCGADGAEFFSVVPLT